MTDESRNPTGACLSLTTLLGVALVTLKLCRAIDWPWVLVLAPFWVPIALFIAVFLILILANKWARL